MKPLFYPLSLNYYYYYYLLPWNDERIYISKYIRFLLGRISKLAEDLGFQIAFALN